MDCQVGDAHALGFPDGWFDGCRADRVLQHLADPPRALGEMVRVARPGARVVLFEPDWGSLLVAADDHPLTRRILQFRCDSVRHGWIGRQLPGMARSAGLAEVTAEAVTFTSLQMAAADPLVGLTAAAEGAAAAGEIAPEAATRWVAQLRRSAADGRFLVALTGFLTTGRKP